MAKRLTEEQIKVIIKLFENGSNIDLLAKQFNCTKLTVIRNLKKNLGEFKFNELFNKNKSLKGKSKTNKNLTIDLLQTNFDDSDLIKDLNDHKVLNENISASSFAPNDSFLEIAPIDFQIDNLSRKELSSVPLSEVDFPKVVFMIVDKKIELEIKYLKDCPNWQFLSQDELKRKTIEIYGDLKIAKSFCNKEQKVIKVPNTEVFKIVAPQLISRGISRIISDDKLIAL